jgi:hypothetical protein
METQGFGSIAGTAQKSSQEPIERPPLANVPVNIQVEDQ